MSNDARIPRCEKKFNRIKDFSLENSESLLKALLELKNAVDSVARIIADFPRHASIEEDRRTVLAVVNERYSQIQRKISDLKKTEEAKAKFEQTEMIFGEVRLIVFVVE